MTQAARPDLLVISAYLAPPSGGIQRLAMEIADAFPHKNVRVMGVSSKEWTDPRVRAVKLRPGKIGGLITLVAFNLAVISELRKKPAVVHAMTWRSAVPLLVFRAAPTALYCHGAELVRAFKGKPEVWLRRKVLERVTGIVSNSHFTAGLVRDVGDRASTIVHPALPFAPDPVDRSDRANDAIAVLSVGRMFPDKGFDRLIDATAALRDKVPMKVTIVGDGPSRADLEAQIARLGLSDVVRLAGGVSDEELRRLYAEADVFALLSTPFNGEVEGFGIVYLEAGAYNLPVVAGNCGGIPDAVADGESGYLTSDVQEAADALARLAADPELRAAMGARGRERALTDFSPAAFGRALDAFYDACTQAFAAGQKL